MKATGSQKLKIGAFTVGAIVLLVVGVFVIGSKQNLFGSTYELYGTFKNTGGLLEGNNVRFGGVNVGTISKIDVVSDTVVRVKMRIETKMKKFFKTDAVASIGSDGLMGDKILVVAPGTDGAPSISDGGRIATAEPLDMGEVMNKFSKVAGNAEVITAALADMANTIKNGNGSISRLLYRDELAKGLEGTLNNTRDVTGALQNIAIQIRSGRGSIGALLYTDTLSRNINSAVATVQVAAANFSENMKALQSNFLFKGYFRKQAEREADSLKSVQESAQNMDAAEMKALENENKERNSNNGKGTATVIRGGQ